MRVVARTFAGALAALMLAAALPAAPALAAPADPAAAQISALDEALIGAMKAGKAAGPEGRFRRLEPAVDRAFDIPTMVRFAVGPAWASFTAAQQQALTTAFGRLTAASYAHNFSSFSGEQFSLDANVATRGVDKLVTTRILAPGEAPVVIAYRMRQSAGGGWKIIDVLYNGTISQLTTRRADFAATVQSGGAPALIAHLNALVDKQLK